MNAQKKPVKPTIPVPPTKPNKASLEEIRVEMSIDGDSSLAEIIAKVKAEGVPEDQFCNLKYKKGCDDSYNVEDSVLSGYVQKEVSDAEYGRRMTAYKEALVKFAQKLADYKIEKLKYDTDILTYEQEALKERLNKEAEELAKLEKLIV
jgi:hypothetical protein